MMRILCAIFLCLALVGLAQSNATIPSADKKGSKDSPLLKRSPDSRALKIERSLYPN